MCQVVPILGLCDWFCHCVEWCFQGDTELIFSMNLIVSRLHLIVKYPDVSGFSFELRTGAASVSVRSIAPSTSWWGGGNVMMYYYVATTAGLAVPLGMEDVNHPVDPRKISRSRKLFGKVRALIAAIFSSDVERPSEYIRCPSSTTEGQPKNDFSLRRMTRLCRKTLKIFFKCSKYSGNVREKIFVSSIYALANSWNCCRIFSVWR